MGISRNYMYRKNGYSFQIPKLKRSIRAFSSIALLLLWIVLERFLQLTEWIYISILITAITFVLLGCLSIDCITPRLPQKIRHFLILWIILKIIFSTGIFLNSYSKT
jgi:hypothetical protein